jgi:non-heme chloroperoxidase
MTGSDTLAHAGTLVERFVVLSTGVRMQYVEHGREDGIPLVLLHGVTDSWHSFERVLPYLPSTIHAFAISQRGHGDSSRPEAGYDFADLAEDLRAFLDAMHVPAAVIVGHSMGAMVAQRFAADHPTRLSALVLTGAFSTRLQHPAVSEFIATAIAPLTDPIDPAFVREFQVSTLAHDVPAEFLETVVSESLKVPARVWRAAFQAHLSTPDLSRDLALLSVPTLLVWGDRDSYAVRGDQNALLAAIPGARLITYAGGGHAVHWEDPRRFARDLAAFVEHCETICGSWTPRARSSTW